MHPQSIIAAELRLPGEKAVCSYVEERIAVEDRGYLTPCWIWQLSRNAHGYGQGKPPTYARVEQAHRFTYRAFVGAIPRGLHIDHLCRVRACCNPAHLEPVTPAENNRRALPFITFRRKTHCKRGHELSPENVFISAKGRRCRLCTNAWQREHGWPRRKKTGEPVKNPQSHCAKGHELTPENTIVWKNSRRCRACNIVWRAEKDDHRARQLRARQRKAVATRIEAGGDSQPGSDRSAKRMALTHSDGGL